MAKHIISIEGTALVAANEEVYTIIAGSDGNDYIAEDVEGVGRVWNVYNSNSQDDTFVEGAPKTQEGIAELVEVVSKKKTRKPKEKDDEGASIEKKRGRKPKQVETTPAQVEKVSEEEDNDAIAQMTSQVSAQVTEKPEIAPKKKTIKKLPSTPEPETVPVPENKKKTDEAPTAEKKLSKYHAFIKEYLAQHSEIVWNKRMQAANEAWKEAKNFA